MTRYGSPVRKTRDGRYAIRLDSDVRAVLAAVATQLAPIVDSDDPATKRVFPPAYTGIDADSASHEDGYRALVDVPLRNHHRSALSVLAATADADSLDAGELASWLSALETMRLVLGTRLDVSEGIEPPDATDPAAPEYAVYELLGIVQSVIVDELCAELPGTEAAGNER